MPTPPGGDQAISAPFRDAQKQFTKLNAEIVGISPDESEDQEKFATKYGLPYAPSSPTPTTQDLRRPMEFGKKKSMYGRTLHGHRTPTVVVGPDVEMCVQIFPKVKVDGHVEAVLEASSHWKTRLSIPSVCVE